MAPSPKKIEEARTEQKAPPKLEIKRAEQKPKAKPVNCFAMDHPPKPGMIPVSTDQLKDGCFVLGWQNQQVTMLVTEGPQWYSYASKILKAQMAFTCVFAFALLLVLMVIRERR